MKWKAPTPPRLSSATPLTESLQLTLTYSSPSIEAAIKKHTGSSGSAGPAFPGAGHSLTGDTVPPPARAGGGLDKRVMFATLLLIMIWKWFNSGSPGAAVPEGFDENAYWWIRSWLWGVIFEDGCYTFFSTSARFFPLTLAHGNVCRSVGWVRWQVGVGGACFEKAWRLLRSGRESDRESERPRAGARQLVHSLLISSIQITLSL